uniref:Uncharacterized protein n=1 Tax=Setaria viridis TaxID=4556 RepID=A0A4U6W8M0_SETVI|nr:hypothetical protein SEVIR_1G152400v2 [Setaria viridis]
MVSMSARGRSDSKRIDLNKRKRFQAHSWKMTTSSYTTFHPTMKLTQSSGRHSHGCRPPVGASAVALSPIITGALASPPGKQMLLVRQVPPALP